MIERSYCLPDKLPEETNDEWCRRAAESIPADAIVRALIVRLMRPENRHESEFARWTRAWSYIADLMGEGSGVAGAIVTRFRVAASKERSRPRIVVLCGSTRFREAFETANRTETLAGRIVLSVGLYGYQEAMDMDGPVKAMLDTLHLRKIDAADEVLVLNVGNYVGESTRREIAYAKSLGKTIRYLEGTD